MTYAPIFRDDVSLFERVTAQVPRVALGHQNLGLAHLRAGDLAEGLAALEQAVAVEPDNPRAQLALAGGYVMAGRPQAAHQILDRIAPRLARQRAFLEVRGLACLAQGEWLAATEALQEATRRYPDFPNLHRLLGQAWERQGDLGGPRRPIAPLLASMADMWRGTQLWPCSSCAPGGRRRPWVRPRPPAGWRRVPPLPLGAWHSPWKLPASGRSRGTRGSACWVSRSRPPSGRRSFASSPGSRRTARLNQ